MLLSPFFVAVNKVLTVPRGTFKNTEAERSSDKVRPLGFAVLIDFKVYRQSSRVRAGTRYHLVSFSFARNIGSMSIVGYPKYE